MDRDDYTSGAKSLHWLIALLIFFLFPLAWVMGDLPGVQKAQAYNLHKSLGITVLALMALRLLWRGFYAAPALPSTMPKLERTAAKLGHGGLYVLLFALPLSGWAMISTSKRQSLLFEYFDFPLLPWLSELPDGAKKSYHESFESAHGILAYLLLFLVAVHAGAALRHAILLKDGIFSRMLLRFGRGSGPSVSAH
ncbi:MAG: cytochrome b [Rhodomicrobium sp.]